MKPTEKNTVAVLVATAHRSELLESRALPSIKRQPRSDSAARVPWIANHLPPPAIRTRFDLVAASRTSCSKALDIRSISSGVMP